MNREPDELSSTSVRRYARPSVSFQETEAPQKRGARKEHIMSTNLRTITAKLDELLAEAP